MSYKELAVRVAEILVPSDGRVKSASDSRDGGTVGDGDHLCIPLVLVPLPQTLLPLFS